MTGCFRFGTGMIGTNNLISQNKSITQNTLECQELCQNIPECKLFNWNQKSSMCFPRTDLPNGLNSFNENVPEAIIGAKDCSDFRIIWPEIIGLNIPSTTTSTSYTISTISSTPDTTTTTKPTDSSEDNEK